MGGKWHSTQDTEANTGALGWEEQDRGPFLASGTIHAMASTELPVDVNTKYVGLINDPSVIGGRAQQFSSGRYAF